MKNIVCISSSRAFLMLILLSLILLTSCNDPSISFSSSSSYGSQSKPDLSETSSVASAVDDNDYVEKIRLLLQKMQETGDLVNNTIVSDLDDIDDPIAFREEILRLFDEYAISLEFPFVPDYASIAEINTIGNTSANLVGGILETGTYNAFNSVIASQGDWIYYADYTNFSKLCKMKSDGTGKTMISEDSVCGINVIGDWVYYRNLSDKDQLYKVRTDGSMRTILRTGAAELIAVAEDWIFFTNKDDNKAVYRIKTDGTSEDIIYKEPVVSMFVWGEWIYCSDESNHNLVRIKINDPEISGSILKNKWHFCAQNEGDLLYYITDDRGLIIESFDIDTGVSELVFRYDGKINYYNLINGRMYINVRDQGNNEKIVIYDPETAKVVRTIDNASSTSISDEVYGYIYYSDEFAGIEWQQIKLK